MENTGFKFRDKFNIPSDSKIILLVAAVREIKDVIYPINTLAKLLN